MTEQPRIPDEETRKRLSANLRKARLDLQEFGLQLEEVEALLDQQIREQKRKRIQTQRQNLNTLM
ncbi:hypothetical protein Cri9333_4592 [Crinalium epipsammum PCC 9333]|uniref:Uncharacterized protein n=1 Tax=Crinalium epipsammum PCC 9333 TaxID=1173022 RepID=K9W6I2_9CYAN|nr:hypothetical protein [Crinalium epipsammum]AFZ15372.1 hypothetical protein Cri9333_4592 [Crinalium epipsammum PCC 9333]